MPIGFDLNKTTTIGRFCILAIAMTLFGCSGTNSSNLSPGQNNTTIQNSVVLPMPTSSVFPLSLSLPSTPTPLIADSAASKVAVTATYALSPQSNNSPSRSSLQNTRNREYISGSNTQIQVVVTPVGGSGTTYGPTSCTTATCTIAFTASPGPTNLAFTLTDASSNVLSSYQTFQIIQPTALNTLNFSANPVVNSITVSLAAASVNAGVALADTVIVNALDSDGNIIANTSNYVNANGVPLAINLSVSNNQAGGSGSVSILGPLRISSPTQPQTIAYYNGGWLNQATITATSTQAIAGSITNATLTTVPHAIEYSVAGSPAGITKGPNNSVWFVEYTGLLIGAMSPNGTYVTYPCTGGCTALTFITQGSDGNLWFSEALSSSVDRITPSGSLTRFPVATNPIAIISGPDGNIWYAADSGNGVGKISTSGTPQFYTTTTAIRGIVFGSDHNIWFSYKNATNIGKMDLVGNILASYTVPNTGVASDGMVIGPDGNIWFTDYGSSTIEKITPAGVITPYSLQTGANPRSIVVGPDGCLWFTEQGVSNIGRITTAGVLTEYGTSNGISAASSPLGITVGPDGNIWYTEYSANKIGKFIY